MSSMNRVILIGHLGRDPETRATKSGHCVANLSIATNRRVKGESDDSWEDRTDWHRVVTFGNTAEQCDRYIRKGRLVAIEGRLQTRSWEEPAGQKHYRTEVVADRVHFLGGKDGSRPPQLGAAPREPAGVEVAENLPF